MADLSQPQQGPLAQTEIPLEELNLSVRVHNFLKRARIDSVSGLMDFGDEGLLGIKGFGSKSAEEVSKALERNGMSLPQQRTPSLVERAMEGDTAAAKRFLREAGFTDAQGQLLPQYQSTPEAPNA